MAKREISNLDLKIKIFKEYLNNGGYDKISFPDILQDIKEIVISPDGKVDPDTVSPLLNACMLALLGSHLQPPFFHPEHISEYISTLQKSNSFEQINVDTTEHFDEVYDEFKAKTDMLFRGQREAKWRLYSNLQRNWMLKRMFESENSYPELLENLVENGRAEYSDQIHALLSSHHIDSENDISVLGYLQHHGCPTPLLDWTFKFQNALFFALDGLIPSQTTIEIEDYLSVYYIEEKYFAGSNLRFFIEDGLSHFEKPMLLEMIAKIAKDEDQRKEMEDHFAGRQLFDRKRITGSGLITHMTKIKNMLGFPIAYFSDKDVDSEILFSLNNSKNILNQAGVFTWNADPSKPLEMMGDELYQEVKPEDGDNNYFFCNCFNIHKNLAGHVRGRLEADGITKDFIYPTPDLNTWKIFEKSKRK